MHPWSDLFLRLPEELVYWVLSFLPYEEVAATAPIAERFMCFTNVEEFYMRKPKPVFAQTVYRHRIRVSPHLGVVHYSGVQLEKRVGQPVRYCAQRRTDQTVQLFMQEVSLRGHNICNSGIKKLLADEGDLLEEKEVEYLDNHFSTEWMPQMTRVLQKYSRSDFDVKGLGLVVARMCVGFVEGLRFSEQTKSQAVAYVHEMRSGSSVFNEAVYATYLDEFSRSAFFRADTKKTEGLT